MVLVIAIYALRQPANKGDEAGSTTAKPATSAAESASKSPATSSAGQQTPTGTSAAAAGKLPLVVLNNTETPNLAAQAEATFKAGGWQVSGIGNLQNNIISTCAYYDPDVTGAQQAAQALMQQFPAIKRTAEKFAGLPAGPIVVVLTPDYVSG